MPDAISTLQTMAIGVEFNGAAPNVALRNSAGTDLYEGCAVGGLLAFKPGQLTKISTITLRLDGTAHAVGPAAVTTVNLVIGGNEHLIQTLTNQDGWIWEGGPIIVPNNASLVVSTTNAKVTTIVQQLFVLHEVFRRVGSRGELM